MPPANSRTFFSTFKMTQRLKKDCSDRDMPPNIWVIAYLLRCKTCSYRSWFEKTLLFSCTTRHNQTRRSADYLTRPDGLRPAPLPPSRTRRCARRVWQHLSNRVLWGQEGRERQEYAITHDQWTLRPAAGEELSTPAAGRKHTPPLSQGGLIFLL